MSSVTEIEFDNLDDLLGDITETVMIPKAVDGEAPKKDMFKSDKEEEFIDNPGKVKDDSKEDVEEDADKKADAKVILDEDLKEIDELLNSGADLDTEEGQKNLNAISEAGKKLIEKGVLLPFEDSNVDEYTAEDWEELIESNLKQKEKELIDTVPESFYETLPKELKKAYEYISNGGKDTKNFFKALAAVEEIKDLNPDNEFDQEAIVRNFLSVSLNYTDDEIEEEITDLKDRGDLKDKALKYKPKLDAMQEKTIQKRIEAQAESKKKQQEQAQIYQDNIYDVLKDGAINGLAIDTKTQNMLFNGLVAPNYQSANGNPTTMLGHLLEKYQFQEPRHDLIAEALWLLADPEGYKTKVKDSIKKEVTASTFRTLKTEQSNKGTASSTGKEEPKVGRKTVSRPTQGGFFKGLK
jgi:hypothetical protein